MNEIIVIDGKKWRVVQRTHVHSEYQDKAGKWHPYSWIAETIVPVLAGE